MENIQTTYKLKEFSDFLLEQFLNYFEAGYRCDVILITGNDGMKIPCHRLILESASEYFATMFNTNLNKNKDNSNEFTINNIDGSCLKTILHSIYSNKIVINNENCLKLYKAAHLMQFKEIANACSEFMIENINNRNCLELLELATTYSNEMVLKKAVQFIFKTFSEVLQTDDFSNLSISALESLLKGSGIYSPSEEHLFEMLRKWVDFDLKNRKCFIRELIVLIKLPLMNSKYFWENAFTWMENHLDDLTFISTNMWRWHDIQKIDSKLQHMIIPRKFGNFLY